MAGNIYKLNLRLSDGSTIDAGNFEAPEGPKGDAAALYGVCSTSAVTKAKTVDITGFSLYVGASIIVKFSETNTALAPTLNVSGTGAKLIRAYDNVAPVSYSWRPGAVIEFVYDGTYWIRVGETIATTEYHGIVQLSDSVSDTSATKAATANAVKQAYDLASRVAGGVMSVIEATVEE